jgi:NAD(P)-dependent dehydrogenase (short-subunit alcohol dehydrogenase family)
MTGRLEGQVALVTGAGQGVGRGVALALAAEGARVAVASRTVSKCEQVVKEIEQRGGTAVPFSLDVTSRESVDTCVQGVREALGPVQILVNNAQQTHYLSIRRLTEEALDDMMQSGPLGTLRCMQACFEDLRATKGCVINFGSGSALTVAPAMGGYAAAKEALRTLSRAAAVEWGPHGVRVNTVLPLAVTPAFDAFSDSLPDGAASTLTRVPLGRMGDPEQDIGRAVVFLASSDAAYVTGTTLPVDGGFDYLR